MKLVAFSFLIAFAFTLSVSAQASANDKKAVIAVVNQFVDGFNKGDIASAVKACASETAIIDEFPPHFWSGSGACENWANDYNANAAKSGITDGVVKLTAFKHVEITGDKAYVVTSANYKWKRKKKPMQEIGSAFVFSLTKTPTDGWRITAWSWGWN